jgi:hypothetical protein
VAHDHLVQQYYQYVLRPPITKAEAERRLRVAMHSLWFCPLARSTCDPNCICFRKGRVLPDHGVLDHEVRDDGPDWRLEPPHCTCYTLTGPEVAD